MKSPKNFKHKQDRNSGIVLLLRFLVRHGEKIFAGGIIVVAIWIASQTRLHQRLSWQPDEMVQQAVNVENAIRDSTFSVVDENEKIFDYATFAEQIKAEIPTEPYRSDSEWNPVIHQGAPPRSGFQVIPAESLRGEARRRISTAAQSKAEQWQRPPQPGTQSSANDAPIWINVYGTIPLWTQWDVFNHVFDHLPEINKPKYVYYELEKAEVNSKEELIWQPVIVYPDYPVEKFQASRKFNSYSDFSPDRLVPFEQRQISPQEQFADSLLLFSDFDVEPARTYAYRIRLYLVNPNFNLQVTSVEEGVDTKNELVRSDWSAFAKVYVPDRTLVQLQSVTLPDASVDFPRQTVFLREIEGTLFLDYFDRELGQSLPLVEKANVRRGMLGNMSKNDANKYINKGRTPEEFRPVNYPDTGLRSDVCIMDFSGGRKLQKRQSREAQGSPNLAIAGKALLLMPDGTMNVISTEQDLFP
ncbi:MAG: hypothetical protein LBI05_05230 [Planctomycetaceae bacterium]|jgi:hypothetical protein|nr:hypothetical protein [Planctomycetaceae bacterium]